MKLISNIFLLALIWLICGARSCNENDNLKEQRDKKLLSASKDSIKDEFELMSPSDQQLKTFENTSIQKLTDFADYLKIASDSSIEATFRKQAAEMAGKLFIKGKINTRSWSSIYHDYDLSTLDKLIGTSLEKGIPCWGQPGGITILAPLTLENDSTFKGKLSFNLQSISFDNLNAAELTPGKCKIEIYALKKAKPFGKEQLKVWEVYLGNLD